VTTPDGVNAELGPWVRMTFPPEALVGLAGAPVSEPLFTSWLLFLCFIPFDRHVFELDEVGERRFVELSHSLLQKSWRHERTIDPLGEGACTVRDIVTVSPRLAALRPLARPVVRMLFRHRHNRLRLLYS